MAEPPNTPARTFTVEQANALLPQVLPRLERLQALHRRVAQMNEQLEAAMQKASQGNGYSLEALHRDVEELTQRQVRSLEEFQLALAQLEETGCVLKDLAQGLVDFYGVRDGELVFLCWRQGEDRIRYWHALAAGFAGRQPINA
jgi:hypothetical protein